MLAVPVSAFNEEQKQWYVRLIIVAILADSKIKEAEISFLKGMMQLIQDSPIKAELLESIQKHQPPKLGPPPEFYPHYQVAIFIEVVEILICDVHLAAPERELLKMLAERFKFPTSIKADLSQWTSDGLAWYHGRSFFVHGQDHKSKPVGKVPVELFDASQRYRYALTLVSTVLLDHQIDPWEQRYVKHAVSLVESDKDKRQLAACLKNKIAPQMHSLCSFPQEWLTMILMEVLMMLSVGVKQLSSRSKDYFSQLYLRANYGSENANKLLLWNQRGIEWRSRKDYLIKKIQFVNA